MKYILLLLLIIPAGEIFVLLLSGRIIGVWTTLSIIILTGVIGAYLAKRQGLEALRRAQLDMQYGRVPGEAIVDGMCILVGGVLLLTPGFITDAIGFLLLIPLTRLYFKGFLKKGLKKWIDNGNVTIIR
ncbi:membrane protein FxsA [Robertmurraya sp. DFI.2.37]|uniref:FxsA family protein n=1 Tax=Robertmurraya sp. DFI.2.37 TaxID=3031819 RepID=UPI001248D74D|nr:FxsA family protein [Robertmurraya sp. DFI.2.37]MDF1507011.1 membrane protein FxsA [Robertmurraya sp. DFI.2.37]